jgi:Domain of unknown function (DUF2017)
VGDYGARQLSPLLPRRLVRRDRRGDGYILNLDPQDREMLRQLIPQFRELLEEPDQPVLRRLFPPAYSEAAYTEQQEEYRRLMQEDLVVRHRDELDLLVSTANADRLSEEQLLAWMGALNSLRLVLGTFLDVQEGDEGREAASVEESIYRWLTYLQGEAIEALASGK